MKQSDNAGERRVYGTLDGMRGVAAAAVVIVHGPVLFGALQAKSAGLAVDLFFVMSGFIIAHAYDSKLATNMSAATFAKIRIIRLYPMYILGLSLGVLAALASIVLGDSGSWTFPILAAAVATGGLMLPTPPLQDDAPAIFPLNPPSWSLFFELLVNFAYAIFYRYTGARTMIALVAGSAVVLAGLGVFHGNLDAGSHWHNFAGGFARVTYSFGAGVLIFRHRLGERVPRVPPLAILLACAAIFLTNPGDYRAIFEFFAIVIALPLLVILGSATEPGRLMQKPFAYLGMVSYAVYSLHYPLILIAKGVLTKLTNDNIEPLTPWLGIAFVAGLVAACGVIHHVYDAPVRALLTKMFVRRARKPELAAETKE